MFFGAATGVAHALELGMQVARTLRNVNWIAHAVIRVANACWVHDIE